MASRALSPVDQGGAALSWLRLQQVASSAHQRRFPRLIEAGMVDLVADNIGLAIRVGWLADSSLQARRIGSFRQLLVGSSKFAGEIEALNEPADFTSLPFVSNHALREPLEWRFTHRDGDVRTARFKADIAINTTPAVMEAVRHGAGLSVLPYFLAATGLLAGDLVPVLPEWQLPSGGVHTVYLAARFRPLKVSAFVDMLIAKLKT